jgi:hypothetical protein
MAKKTRFKVWDIPVVTLEELSALNAVDYVYAKTEIEMENGVRWMKDRYPNMGLVICNNGSRRIYSHPR